MSESQGEAPQSRRAKIIGGTIAGLISAAAIAAAAVFAVNVHAGQEAHAQLMASVKTEGKALTAAAGEDVRLANTAAEATEVARLKAIADQRAAELAAQQAAAAAAQAAAEAARQAAAQQAAADEESASGTPGGSGGSASASGPVKCPAGTHANAVDADGNESACEADGPNGEQCQAYDANNNCTNWYKP